MLTCKNIHILGTSHISTQSINEITQFVANTPPDIIAIELDKSRLHSLFHKKNPSFRDIKHLGIKSFTLNLIGHYIEHKLGKAVGVSPGDEMKQAVRLAKKHHLKLALIDQPIEITLKKLSKQVTFKEKLNFLLDIIKSPFSKPLIEPFDLSKPPPKSTVKKMLSFVSSRYPSVYNILIEERNQIMAKNLYTLSSKYKDAKILAVVGLGHEDAIKKLLKRANSNNHNNSSININF